MERTYFVLFLLGFSIIIFTFVFLNSNVISDTGSGINKIDIGDINMFYNYRKKFNKTYSAKEFYRRFRNFKESLRDISILNEKEHRPVFKLTKFSDMSKEEFASQMMTKMEELHSTKYKNCAKNKPLKPILNYRTCHLNVTDRPAKFDWRNKGVVSPVLDQKRCHVCYAFGPVGVMESVTAIKENSSVNILSKQELIDCTKAYSYSSGCQGGNIFKTLKFLCDSKFHAVGLVNEDLYPLTLIDSTCKIKSDVGGRKLKEFLICQDIDEDNLPGLIWKFGPAIAVVNSLPWLNYVEGIIQRACEKPVDFSHVVQIVGYNTEGPIPYYIIRNSWGEDFGEDGYLKLKIGDNLCGIAHEVGFVDTY